jgi:hypothetical protein
MAGRSLSLLPRRAGQRDDRGILRLRLALPLLSTARANNDRALGPTRENESCQHPSAIRDDVTTHDCERIGCSAGVLGIDRRISPA